MVPLLSWRPILDGVVIVSATLATFDRRLERAALSMQASPIQTFVRVTMPLIRPGIIGGALFAFIRSFDEVVQTSLVSGFTIRTLPLKMSENMRNELDPTIAAIGSLLNCCRSSGWWRSMSHGGAPGPKSRRRWRNSYRSIAQHTSTRGPRMQESVEF